MDRIENILSYNKKGFLYFLLPALLLLTYFYIARPAYSELLYQYQDSVRSFKNDIMIKNFFEGKNIRDICTDNTTGIFNGLIDNNNKLLIVLEDVSCYSCVKFHLEHIEKLNKKGLPVYSIAFDKEQLVKSYVNHAVDLGIKENFISIPFSYELLIFLIDERGDILKVDIADKNNYFKSQFFYTVLERFVAK